MLLMLHRFAALVAILCIALFFSTTIVVELLGTQEAIATLKSLIVWPGLLVLLPAIALTGATGFALAKSDSGKLAQNKKKRMPFIAANGLVLLIPCAILLDIDASAGAFGIRFYILQSIELLAGACNLILMGMNIRDGLRMSGRLPPQMVERLN